MHDIKIGKVYPQYIWLGNLKMRQVSRNDTGTRQEFSYGATVERMVMEALGKVWAKLKIEVRCSDCIEDWESGNGQKIFVKSVAGLGTPSGQRGHLPTR